MSVTHYGTSPLLTNNITFVLTITQYGKYLHHLVFLRNKNFAVVRNIFFTSGCYVRTRYLRYFFIGMHVVSPHRILNRQFGRFLPIRFEKSYIIFTNQYTF